MVEDQRDDRRQLAQPGGAAVGVAAPDPGPVVLELQRGFRVRRALVLHQHVDQDRAAAAQRHAEQAVALAAAQPGVDEAAVQQHRRLVGPPRRDPFRQIVADQHPGPPGIVAQRSEQKIVGLVQTGDRMREDVGGQ